MIVQSETIQYYNGIWEFDSRVSGSFERLVSALKCEDKTLGLNVWEKKWSRNEKKKVKTLGKPKGFWLGLTKALPKLNNGLCKFHNRSEVGCADAMYIDFILKH